MKTYDDDFEPYAIPLAAGDLDLATLSQKLRTCLQNVTAETSSPPPPNSIVTPQDRQVSFVPPASYAMAPKKAAVLLILHDSVETNRPAIWMIKRPSTMRIHSGQMGFPGGKYETQDQTLQETVERETEEELGVSSIHYRHLGQLGDFITRTGFRITPFVSVQVTPPFVLELRLNPQEVEHVTSVPLELFASKPEKRDGRLGYTFKNEFIWGASFGIGRELIARLSQSSSTV